MAPPAKVPDQVLSDFFQQATETLEQTISLESPAHSLAEIRERLLSEQTASLQSVVDQYDDLTLDEVQAALRRCSPNENQGSVLVQMERMNEAARLAFARLVLYSECLWNEETDTRDLKASGELQDDDVRTFCGLCQAVIKLPFVETHLRSGREPLFAELPASGDTKTILPQKRLECIQRMFLKAIGYEPDFATRAIKEKFYHDNNDSIDASLQSTFTATIVAMEAALVQAAASSMHDTFFSDKEETDGVTKVVAVQYSEKLIDETTGEELLTLSEDASPQVETMADSKGDRESSDEAKAQAERREQLRLAQQASVLQQQILGELLTMRDEEREAKLEQAREATRTVLQKAMQFPPGPERVAVLTSVDPATQRLMAMHKLWDTMLAANGGVPPKMHSPGVAPGN